MPQAPFPLPGWHSRMHGIANMQAPRVGWHCSLVQLGSPYGPSLLPSDYLCCLPPQGGRAPCRGGSATGAAQAPAGAATSWSSSSSSQRQQGGSTAGASWVQQPAAPQQARWSRQQHGANAPGAVPGCGAAARSRVQRQGGAGERIFEVAYPAVPTVLMRDMHGAAGILNVGALACN